MAQILYAANGGSTKTKIMYKTFLSYERLKEYIAFLIENELLTFDKSTMIVSTTPRGLQFVDTYNKLYQLLGHATLDSPKKIYLKKE